MSAQYQSEILAKYGYSLVATVLQPAGRNAAKNSASCIIYGAKRGSMSVLGGLTR